AHPEGFTRHVRDPKVWYSETEAKWFLLLGAQTNELLGTAIWYVSTNLIEWEYLGEILSADSEAYMWECPDLFELDGQWVFLLSPQGLPAKGHQFQNIYHSVYFPVVRAGSKYEMVNEKMLEIDWGFEFYAPQTFEADDGRRILYAWMGVMEPEVEQATPTISEGWIHNLTIPRELQFENGKLKQYPVPELALLRKNKTTYTLSEPWLVASDEYAYELLMDVESEASFTLSIKDGTKLFYDVKDRSLTLERINWLTQQPETRKTLLDQPLTDVHIFIDGSSIEIFSNAGTSVASARFFEEGPFVMRYEGEITGRIDIYELEHKNPLS
ncbi:GH32 C-terminal domain-containing protein, partial [Jeotgalibaca porci]